MKILISLLLSSSFLFAQNASISGVLTSKDKIIEFANVGLAGTVYGTSTNEKGFFELKDIKPGMYNLQISAIGFKRYQQNITVKNGDNLKLNVNVESSTSQLNEVVITGTLKEVSIMESAVPIEVYTPAYFKKNPTPALFESLQIVNGVRPQINCSVCNTGDIHINGMEGPYTMVTIDGMPIVGGLASVYGLNGIPNSMIEQMEVVKGPASTLYGSEAVGGLINVITKSPDRAPDFSIDVFGTTWGEINTDVSVKFKLNEKVSSMLGLNYFNYSIPKDNNGDNFTDVTLQDRISLFNKWSFKRKNDRQASIGLRYIYEDRWGGEMDWTPEFRGGDSLYGESIYTSRFELIGKYHMPVKETIISSFSLSNHNQDSRYGNTSYIAQQNIAFGQLFWDKTIMDVHNFVLGTALRYNYYDDNTSATFSSDTINRTNKPENYLLPGVFLQDEISLNEKNKLLLGLRYDYDSRHGSILTPRANYKWSVNDNNIIRLSFGTGYRVVNLFTEDHAATTGAREVVVFGALKPEQSYNVNLAYQKFINTGFGFINFDGALFYTYFTNKIAPDYETNPQQIIYENLNGNAVSRGGSFNLGINFSIPLNIKVGGTFLDVYQMEENLEGKLERQEQLLTEKVSGTYSVAYHLQKANIKIDYNGNVYGPMKLPLVENDFRPAYSDWYSIQNIQVTKTFKKGWEVYGGVKNILNFTPPAYSILRPEDPFDKNVNDPINNPNGYTFDPTYVYASNQGIRGFFGIRYTFLK
ncbi:TonB-dependent receptor [Vicingus serpentipes]|uniref:TonB-dependent receptor n=1 Tax=Vicingus serpentipes TaxID=1926625 RepID=A0A5C6RY02_9FLAO|nr:TonB-dependent receptor [Vicingus serpentipes]TXB67053.1 TonB-dependent receptor [Vicingus serpentipes]